MKIVLRGGIAFLIVSFILWIATTLTHSDTPLWQDVDETTIRPRNSQNALPKTYRLVRADVDQLQTILAEAPAENFRQRSSTEVILSLPLPDGTMSRFRVESYSVMAPALAAKYPKITAYKGEGIDDPTATARLDWGPRGLNAIILSSQGTFFISPYSRNDTAHYLSYDRTALPPTVIGDEFLPEELRLIEPQRQTRQVATSKSNDILRTYRLAVATTGEYSQSYGGTVEETLAAVNTMVNQVNAIFEREVAIRFTLIANTDQVIYLDPEADPYTGNDKFVALTEVQNDLDTNIGTANYDVGHVFGAFAGGIAFSGICNNSRKGTGVSNDLLFTFVHELGHQFAASHTFNAANAGWCIGNRQEQTPYEPGSGTTIMSYSGNCDEQDLQEYEDGSFHTASFEQMIDYVTIGEGSTCGTQTNTGNQAPTVNAGPSYTIPSQTAFNLTGSGNDPDGDTLTYSWEQFDLGPPPDRLELPNQDDGSRPIFRSYPPVTSPTRFFPSIVSPTLAVKGEYLPTTSRNLTFRLTARDNRGGVSYDTTSLVVDNNAGPFQLTSPSGEVIWQPGSEQTITWDVANTDQPPINCSTVDIALSTDGGQTFDISLADNVSNSGTAQITVPNITFALGLLRVSCVDNIFFTQVDSTIQVCQSVWLDDHEGGKTNWQARTLDRDNPWQLNNDGGYSGQQYWFVASTKEIFLTDSVLESPLFRADDDVLFLRFAHRYQLHGFGNVAFDAGVVEIKVNDVDWVDVGAENFVLAGYNSQVSNIYDSSLAGQLAFSGVISDYIKSFVDLSPFLNTGDTFQIHFRQANDIWRRDIDTTKGWSIDDVSLCEAVPQPVLSLAKSVQADEPVRFGSALTYTITLSNSGAGLASNVHLTDTLPLHLNGSDLNETLTISPQSYLTFTLTALLSNTAPYNTLITNTAYFSHTSSTGQASATFRTFSEPTPTTTPTATDMPTNTPTLTATPTNGFAVYLPVLVKSPPPPTPTATPTPTTTPTPTATPVATSTPRPACSPDTIRETDDIADSVRICLNQVVTGRVDWDSDNFFNSDRQDVYKITLYEGETVQFILKGETNAPSRVSLFEPGTTTTNGTTTYRTNSGAEEVRLTFTVDQTGEWFVQVSPNIFAADLITLNYELQVVQVE